MQLGMIGVGRMGGNMTLRLLAAGHDCVAFALKSDNVEPLLARAREDTGCVVTHGLGPRYLHSTGQLHKGGPNTGLFVQVVDDPGDEVSIPGKKFGFRRLIHSQAAGDLASLEERGRRIIRLRLGDL